MKNRRFYIYALAFLLLMGACGCEKPKSQDDPQPQQDTTQVPETIMDNPDMKLIVSSVPVTDNWVWSGKPQIKLRISNANAGAVKLGAKVVVTTDKKVDVVTLTDSVLIGAKAEKDFVITTTQNLEPGI